MASWLFHKKMSLQSRFVWESWVMALRVLLVAALLSSGFIPMQSAAEAKPIPEPGSYHDIHGYGHAIPGEDIPEHDCCDPLEKHGQAECETCLVISSAILHNGQVPAQSFSLNRFASLNWDDPVLRTIGFDPPVPKLT